MRALERVAVNEDRYNKSHPVNTGLKATNSSFSAAERKHHEAERHRGSILKGLLMLTMGAMIYTTLQAAASDDMWSSVIERAPHLVVLVLLVVIFMKYIEKRDAEIYEALKENQAILGAVKTLLTEVNRKL